LDENAQMQPFLAITSAETENTTRLYDMSGQLMTELAGIQINDMGEALVGLSRDGQRLITVAEAENTIQLYDLSGKLITELKVEGELGGISEDGRQVIATSEADNITRLYDFSE
jgi:WD40 repeat protein